jgi:nitroreductase
MQLQRPAAPDAAASTALPTSETIEVLLNRVSVRKFAERPIDDAHVEAILRAAFRAPTSSNIQSYSVVVVRDRAVLKQLQPITGGQPHVAVAPLFLAFCVDLTRIEAAMRLNGHNFDDNNFEVGLVSAVDAALVGMSAYLAADSLGIKGVMIGAVRNDAAATARILNLPRRVYCLFGMCLGWPAEAPPQKPRMPYAAMVHYEQYGNRPGEGAVAASVDVYDRQLAAHYRAIGKATTDDSWSRDMDKKFVARLRDNLRNEVRAQGFDFL